MVMDFATKLNQSLILLKNMYNRGSGIENLETLSPGQNGRVFESGLGLPATGKLSLSTQQ